MSFFSNRPKWYKKYHKSFLSEIFHWSFLILSLFILFVGFRDLIFYANASKVTTIITQKVFPGRIGISIPSLIFFSPVMFSSSNYQIATAALRGLEVSDLRNDENTSWAVTASCTDFFAINQPIKATGEN
ncbi:MAG: hypothetical protein KGL95_14905, partial [Patescibacteria group bacterium]|nr:hypothetical protein [Patescibacteria group bacterium]